VSGTGVRRAIGALARIVPVVLLTLAVVPAPVAWAGDAAPSPPAAVSANALTDALTDARETVTALQQHEASLTAQLAAATAKVAALQRTRTARQRDASALVARAREQAIETYVRGEPAAQPFTIVQALGLGDPNDVAWTLGVLKVTQEQSLDLLREAQSAGATADLGLTDADADVAALTSELAHAKVDLQAAQQALVMAQQALDTYVKALAPATVTGMSTVAYAAYVKAAAALATEAPSCGLRWELLAAIGKTESNHGSGRLDAAGNSVVRIVGIAIGPDTDGGTLDGDPAHDHAVGPMQFIPSTWHAWGADGNGDGKADPGNVFDATLAAGRYLCHAAGALTLRTRDGVIRAILAYNPNLDYLRLVGERFEALARDVANGWFSTGDLPLPAAFSAGNADGGGPPVDLSAAAAPPTTVHRLSLFTGGGVGIQTSGSVVVASCTSSSAVLTPRAGFVRCMPADGSAALDPCAVSPSDPTLVACLPDPTRPGRVVRASAPVTAPAPTPGPPYFGLMLTGGDLCLPVGAPPAAAPGRGRPATQPTTTTSSTTAPERTSTTAGSSTTSSEATTSTVAPTTAAPTTTTQPTTTAARPTTTTAASQAPVTPGAAAAPIPPGASYLCASGATATGQPDTSGAAWQAVVTQPGVAPRPIAVTDAWT
jgi:membrane-bound lytic murein transglycosylase B